jgi:hypothetical protein
VKRAFHLLDELGHSVQGKSGLEIAEIADPYPEGVPLSADASARKPATQRLVHNLAERPASPARFRLELGRYIVVQGKRRSHVLMLLFRHHDVNGL